jgi:hypothetical protein
MANMLIPAEERFLTPEQVEALDRRRRRGHTLLVIGWQTAIIAIVLTLWSGQDLTYSPGDLLCARHRAAPRAERVFQLLSSLQGENQGFLGPKPGGEAPILRPCSPDSRIRCVPERARCVILERRAVFAALSGLPIH